MTTTTNGCLLCFDYITLNNEYQYDKTQKKIERDDEEVTEDRERKMSGDDESESENQLGP